MLTSRPSAALPGPGSPARRRLATVLAAGLALAAGVLAFAPAPASAAAPSGFVGLQGWTMPSPGEFQQLGRANIGYFRANLVWGSVEGSRGRYDWRSHDVIFILAAAAGMRVLPVVMGTPAWASSGRPFWPPRTARGRRAYVRFVAAAVRRYGPGGQFWAEHPELPELPVIYWQIWNETNLPNYWLNRPSPRQYVAVVRAAGRAAKAVSPGVKIVLAGLPHSRAGVPMARYLEGVYRVRGAKKAFDVVALHPYARDHRGVLRLLGEMRRVMRRYHDSGTPTWITETGWASAGRRDRRGFVTNRSGQASRLRKLYGALVRKRRAYRLLGAIWFSHRDPRRPPGNAGWWGYHTGLFTAGGRPKPAWRALLKVTGGQDYDPRDDYAPARASAIEAAGSHPHAPGG